MLQIRVWRHFAHLAKSLAVIAQKAAPECVIDCGLGSLIARIPVGREGGKFGRVGIWRERFLPIQPRATG
jgi:hypothetical protein